MFEPLSILGPFLGFISVSSGMKSFSLGICNGVSSINFISPSWVVNKDDVDVDNVVRVLITVLGLWENRRVLKRDEV